MCCDLVRFSDICLVTGVTVSVPNGLKDHFSYIGNVCISSHITLHNVLYVPHFIFNLISINCLIKDNHFYVNFYLDHCIIQEYTWDLMIGRGNLYILDTSFSSFDVCASLLTD